MLQLYDLNKIKIKGLRLYKDMNIESVLSSGDKTLSFLYPSKLPKDIKEECYIRTKKDEFVVKEISTNGEWNSIKARLNVDELEGQAWEHFDTTEKTIAECLTLAVAGTGWTVQVTGVTKKRTIRKTNCSTWDIIQQAKKTYLVEIEFDTINKVVKVAEKLGTDKGVYFMDSLNLRNLDVQSNSYDFFTRIIAIGKDDLKTTVENFQYSSKKKTFIWKDERYTDIASLTEDATKKLEEISKPYKAYGADIIDLANTSNKYSILSYGLGDTITLISKDKGIKEKQRIVKITEYPEEPHRNSCEIANSILSFADIQKEYNDTMDTVSNITEDNGTVSEGAIRTAVEHLTVNKLDVGSLNAVEIRVGNLEATSATITQLKAVNASIVNLQANKANITDLTASVGRIEILESSVGDIQTLVNGNLTSNNIQSLILSSDKVTVVNGFIKNAMIENLDVSKINAGDISVNKFRIKSDSGNLLIFDNTIQIKDSTRVRVQIGKDASNDYSMYVWDSSGKLMFDATGLKADGIKNKIIRDDMVSDNANISGDKLNISSVVTSINNGAATLNSSKVHIDGTAQTLDVAFNTLTTKVDSAPPSITTDSSITKLDGAIDGMLKLNSISGRTLRNEVVNGDFSNGTSRWGIGNATAGVVNGEVVMLASSNIGRLEQRINGNNGDRLYQVALIKTTSSLVGLGVGGSVLQKHSGSGNYERISNIYAIGTLGYMFTSVADNRTSGWDNIYIKRYTVVNLTAMFGVGNEPTKEWCDANISFFEGIQSVGESENLELVSCGKNLFDKNKVFKGYLNSSTGDFVPYNTRLCTDFIPLSAGEGVASSLGDIYISRFFFYDVEKKFISAGSSAKRDRYNIYQVTPTNTKYIRVQFLEKGSSTFQDIFDLIGDTLQIEKGTSSTSYEPYKGHRQHLSLTNSLRGLPNGVRDTVDFERGVVVRNVGKVLLDDNVANYSVHTATDTLIQFRIEALKNKRLNLPVTPVICTHFNYYGNHSLTPNREGIYAINSEDLTFSGICYIAIEKSKLKTLDVAGFVQWLQANPVTIYYQFATPVKEPIIAEQYMKQFKDGYFLTDGSLINPIVELEYSTSLASATSMMKEVTESNTTAINVQQGKISALISNTTIVKDGVTTQLKDAYNSTVATVDSISSVISSHTSTINNLTGQITGVETKTNEVRRDLDGTTATVTAHTDSINGLNSTIATQSSSITQLSNQIALKVEATQVTNIVNGAIDKIEVGGRNLIRNSKINRTSNLYSFETRTLTMDLVEGVEYTFSVNGRCDQQALDDGKKLSAYIYEPNWQYPSKVINIYSLTDTTEKISFVSAWSGQARVGFYLHPSGGSRLGTVTVNWAKLEQGNKPTDWTPAPEDVDSAINNVGERVTVVSNKAASIETSLAGITSRVSNVETTTSTLNGDLKTLTTRMTTAEQKITDSSIISTVSSAINEAKYDAVELAKAMNQGNMLYPDATFTTGTNGINRYNNSAGSLDMSVTRMLKPSDCPTTSTHCLEVKTFGPNTSPGLGGFYFGNTSRANAIFIFKMIANIPVGSKLMFASNSYGTGGSAKWLTSNEGTGKWEEYIHKVTCGSSGTFSTTNFFYIDKGTIPFMWRIASATVYDITDTADLTMRVNSAEQKITDTAIVSTVRSSTSYKGDLGAKVSSNAIISCINQTAESIKISASKINLTGYVTMTNLSTAGQTIIDGGNIKTNTISLERLKSATNNPIIRLFGKCSLDATAADEVGVGSAVRLKWNAENYIYIATNNMKFYQGGVAKYTITPAGLYLDGADLIINGGFLTIGGKQFRGWGFSSGNKYWLGISNDDKYVRMYNNDVTVANGVTYIGSPSGRYIKVYSTQAADVSSDRRKKNNILSYNEKIETFYDNLKPISYELINGHSGRKHYGFIAQDVESAMDVAGLDYKDMALLQKAPMDAEGNEIDPTTIVDYSTDERIVDYEYSLAYTEMISINTHMIQKLRQEITKLKNEISEIKGLG